MKPTAPVVGAVAGLVALAILVPGLGDHGIWSADELPVFDRTRAALGAAVSGLERSPWLPDALRTAAYDALGGAAGLRLPHALSGVGLVALAAGIARWRGMSIVGAALAGALALAFPILGVSARTAMGNPIGELLIGLTILTGLLALRDRGARGVIWAAACAGLAVLSVSAIGLALGLGVPLATLAIMAVAPAPSEGSPQAAPPPTVPRLVRLALVAGAVVTIGIAIMLSLRQADGYIPILGAAKDLELIDKPQLRRFAAGFEDFGYHLFPWTPLVLVGALSSDRDRLGPVWLGCAVLGAAAWSVIYGSIPSPAVIPGALCGAAAIERLARPETPAVWRRVVLTATIGGVLVLGKDAELAPERIAAPMSDFPGGRTFPGDELDAMARLKRLRSLAALAVLLAGLAAARRGRLGRVMGRVPQRVRPAIPPVVVGLSALAGGLAVRGMVTDLSTLVSPRAVLARYDAWVEAGALPAVLGTHRVRDPGMELYGPGNVEVLSNQRDVTNWLSADEPRVALIRDRDLPAVHMHHRHNAWPLYVLDDSHGTLRLIANVLPEGATDLNRIPEVLFDEPPPLQHETMLRFENYVEVIGWQVTEPIVRGRKATIEVALRVLRPLPGGCKLYTRLLKDRSSRMAIEPQPLAMDVYPPNRWREGDYILHRYEFDAPPLEIQWGEHELIIGLRRSERENLEITVPEGKKGDFGVSLRGSKRNFATVGTVQVY